MAAKSERLDSHLESHQTQDVMEKLAWLQAMGIDAEVFARFQSKVVGILDKNPGSEDVVAGEIGKLCLTMENTLATYKRTFWGLMMAASNNPDWNPDESLVA